MDVFRKAVMSAVLCLCIGVGSLLAQNLQQQADPPTASEIKAYAKSIQSQQEAQANYEEKVQEAFKRHHISEAVFTEVVLHGEERIPADQASAFAALKKELAELKTALAKERMASAETAGFTLARYEALSKQIAQDHRLMNEVHGQLIKLNQ